ncbi:nSTAND1 domain-containing NTPase [Ruegeria arenilitoris]|uniref:nSTAND1 domain-containing NTPase n=1 Tax=Ruegeria arenilitoris TaxID=1173585 RepID=UPI00147ACA66|nr:hypothetical protein [Ruegeria arenilitoris]
MLTDLKPSEIENAFQPAKEIDDATKFSGRKEAFENSFFGLMSNGSNLAIVGNRGIGKTSLARQIQTLALGNNELADRLNIGGGHSFDFLVAYYACGSGTETVEEMLARVLASEHGLGSWLYYLPKTTKMMNALSPKLAIKLFGSGGEIGGNSGAETVNERIVVPTTMQGVFENVAQDILDSGMTNDGLLVIIDEFDQIENPSGFASFLKALATNVPKVKFCLVGVAKDIQDLMKEHESADRLFAGSVISLKPMERAELLEIISVAERAVHNKIRFTDAAKSKMVSLAAGHPYLIHLVGKFAFRDAFRNGLTSIDVADIDRVIRSIAENESDPVLEGRYRKAVASSRQREIVLKALVQHQDDKGEIWTTNAYRTALEQGVDNASQYVGQLVTKEFGAELEKVRERYYRFKDSLFAAYVDARPLMREL